MVLITILKVFKIKNRTGLPFFTRFWGWYKYKQFQSGLILFLNLFMGVLFLFSQMGFNSRPNSRPKSRRDREVLDNETSWYVCTKKKTAKRILSYLIMFFQILIPLNSCSISFSQYSLLPCTLFCILVLVFVFFPISLSLWSNLNADWIVCPIRPQKETRRKRSVGPRQ